MKKELFNLPNTLSWIRLFLVPVYWVLFFTVPIIWSVAVFVVASITDFLDGRIARKYNMITDSGKFLDPLADKCLQISALLTLSIGGYLSWFLTILIFVKELYMIICGLILYKRNVVVSSNIIGKAATVIMLAGLFVIYLSVIFEFYALEVFGSARIVGTYMVCAGIGISVMAAIFYSYITIKQLNGKLPDGKEKINIKM